MADSNLFSEFPSHSESDWQAKIEKDLKGKAFSDLLKTDANGNTIRPLYTAEGLDLKDQPLKEHPKWDIVHEICVVDEKSANAEALNFLNRGATSLIFYLQGKENLSLLLKDIEIQYICLNLVLEAGLEGISQQLVDLIKERGIEESELEGSINFDPLENLLRKGNWYQSQEEDFSQLKKLQAKNFAGLRSVCLNVNHAENAGANHAQQLGLALAMAYEYVHQLDLKSTRGFWVNFAIGSDYFAEISKVRAFRRLWQQMQKELDLETTEVRIYAETSQRNKTKFDRFNNLIRSTAEAMAAIIGGATEVNVKEFDLNYQEPEFFSKRLALNQLSILQHESYFHQVRDMGRGAYFIESLTEDIAQKGWAFFKEIEAQGGYIAALKNGFVQKGISAQAEKQQAAFDAGGLILVGANKYFNANEKGDFAANSASSDSDKKADTWTEALHASRLSAKLEDQQISQIQN
jgi:methylmalonyl-CoA mutase